MGKLADFINGKVEGRRAAFRSGAAMVAGGVALAAGRRPGTGDSDFNVYAQPAQSNYPISGNSEPKSLRRVEAMSAEDQAAKRRQHDEYMRQENERRARQKLIAPLEEERDAEHNQRYRMTSTITHQKDRDFYLESLKSVRPWFRAHVRLEHDKKHREMYQSYTDRIEKLLTSPLDQLDEYMRSEFNKFLAEFTQEK